MTARCQHGAPWFSDCFLCHDPKGVYPDKLGWPHWDGPLWRQTFEVTASQWVWRHLYGMPT